MGSLSDEQLIGRDMKTELKYGMQTVVTIGETFGVFVSRRWVLAVEKTACVIWEGPDLRSVHGTVMDIRELGPLVLLRVDYPAQLVKFPKLRFSMSTDVAPLAEMDRIAAPGIPIIEDDVLVGMTIGLHHAYMLSGSDILHLVNLRLE